MPERSLPAAPPPEVTFTPTGRPLALTLVCIVNALMSAPFLVALLVHAQLPPQLAKMPAGFFTFAKLDAATLLAAVVGLWLQRRWGFGLLIVAYFGAIIALVVMRQPFVCQVMMQFPFVAITSLQWKHLH